MDTFILFWLVSFTITFVLYCTWWNMHFQQNWKNHTFLALMSIPPGLNLIVMFIVIMGYYIKEAPRD